jgi:hypothetical protein
MRGRFLGLIGWLALLLVVSPATAADYEFRVSFSNTIRQAPYTGRVYLFFGKDATKEPRQGPDWFHPEPIVAIDVQNWKPGEALVMGTTSKNRLLAFPRPLAELDLAGHRVQAVARFNPYERRVGTGPGNGYSASADVLSAAGGGGLPPQELLIDQLGTERPFPENQWFKLVQIRSGLLSDFHRRDVSLRGGVLLPAGYHDQPQRRYPVILEIPGFGGTHLYRGPREPIREENEGGVEFLRVTLDPSCPLGHHAFADSANNGPVGEALVTELIPELDRQFRTISAPTARFLTGHSSGGWSSLWLQVTYPDTFGGTWSTSPDPVDFRDFQRINLYRSGENMYRDRGGNRRPLARLGDQVALWYDDFDHMEEVVGFGGQLHSFEAVFSPRGVDGRPVRVWDRKTGDIDTAAARKWKKYDIRLLLEKRWPELGPKLAGKLHVFQGELDTFYLEGATILLKQALASLNSDAVVEILTGKTHFDLLSPDLHARMRREMVTSYLRHHPERK